VLKTNAWSAVSGVKSWLLGELLFYLYNIGISSFLQLDTVQGLLFGYRQWWSGLHIMILLSGGRSKGRLCLDVELPCTRCVRTVCGRRFRVLGFTCARTESGFRARLCRAMNKRSLQCERYSHCMHCSPQHGDACLDPGACTCCSSNQLI